MTKPNGRGLKRAKKKQARLTARGARPRALRRLGFRVARLQAAYDKRVQEMRKTREAVEAVRAAKAALEAEEAGDV